MTSQGNCRNCGRFRYLFFSGGLCSMTCAAEVRAIREREKKNRVDFSDTDSIPPAPPRRQALIAEAKRILHIEGKP